MSGHGLLFRSLDLQDADDPEWASIWLDLVSGLREPSDVRGVDITYPGAPGQTWMPKVTDARIIELAGFVHGHGTTLEERQVAWGEATEALMAVLDRTLAPGAFIVLEPYLGLTENRSIEATCLNFIPGPITGRMTHQTWSIQLKAYEPDWETGS